MSPRAILTVIGRFFTKTELYREHDTRDLHQIWESVQPSQKPKPKEARHDQRCRPTQ